MKIRIIMPYHENMHDTINALSAENDTLILTPKMGRDMHKKSRIIRTFTLSNKLGKIPYMRDIIKSIHSGIDAVIVKHLEMPYNLYCYVLCRMRNVPLVINVQKFSIPNSRVYRIWLGLLVFLIGKKVAVWSVTKKGAKNAENYFSNVDYIPICIDPQRFRTRKQGKKSQLRIFCVSKYQNRKNLPVLIEAFERISAVHPKIDFRLKIAGTSFSKGRIAKQLIPEKKVYEEIKKLIYKKKLGDKIELLRDLEYPDMPKHYSDSDLFVFPASKEPLGYSLVEAMASALPVICTDEIGARCYIKEGKSGYIIKAKDSKAIEQSIGKFIKYSKPDWDKINIFGKRNRIIVENELSFSFPEEVFRAYEKA